MNNVEKILKEAKEIDRQIYQLLDDLEIVTQPLKPIMDAMSSFDDVWILLSKMPGGSTRASWRQEFRQKFNVK